LRARPDAGRNVLHPRKLADRLGIGGCQGVRHALALPDTTLGEVARVHVDDVGPGRLDLLFDRRARAASERHHRDDGAHADDHPQHREDGPHLVAAERLQRDPEGHEQ
jgi:hypothetical protein